MFMVVFLSRRNANTACDLLKQAEIRRHLIGDREWEVYRILVDEGEGLRAARSKIEEGVWRMLMGWD